MKLEHDDDDEDMNVSDNHDLGHIIRIVIIQLLNNFFFFKVDGDWITTENVLTLNDGTKIVSKEKFNKIE